MCCTLIFGAMSLLKWLKRKSESTTEHAIDAATPETEKLLHKKEKVESMATHYNQEIKSRSVDPWKPESFLGLLGVTGNVWEWSKITAIYHACLGGCEKCHGDNQVGAGLHSRLEVLPKGVSVHGSEHCPCSIVALHAKVLTYSIQGYAALCV